MKNNINFFALGILTLTLTLASCNNEVELPTTTTKPTKEIEGILSFKSQAEFDSTLQKVNAMSEEQRKEWEKSKGFKSFGTICDDFYGSINYENFSNIDEIRSFVEVHKSLIQLVQDDLGETTCLTQDYNNSERFLMNENRMYIIGNKAYKDFSDQGKISCEITNINVLAKLKDFSGITKNQHFNYEVIEKSVARAKLSSGTQYFERTEEKSIEGKKYRTIVRVEAVHFVWGSLGMPSTIPLSYCAWFRIRNQTLSIIWWNTKTSTEYAPFEYTISNGTDNFSGVYDGGWGRSTFTETIDDKAVHIGFYPYHVPTKQLFPYLVRFDGFVHSTFRRTKGKKFYTTKISVNLKYPY